MKKRSTLKQKVYSDIKTKILNFEFKPGEKLYENVIAESLGISRTPIREALSTLLQEGLIKTTAAKGYFVSDLKEKEIKELFELREALETYAIRTAHEKADAEDWDRLINIAVKIKTACEINEDCTAMELFQASHWFYKEMAKLSQNDTLLQFLNTIADRLARAHFMTTSILDRFQRANAEQLELLKLLKKGEVEKALEIHKKHVQDGVKYHLHQLQERKNFLYVK